MGPGSVFVFALLSQSILRSMHAATSTKAIQFLSSQLPGFYATCVGYFVLSSRCCQNSKQSVQQPRIQWIKEHISSCMPTQHTGTDSDIDTETCRRVRISIALSARYACHRGQGEAFHSSHYRAETSELRFWAGACCRDRAFGLRTGG